MTQQLDTGEFGDVQEYRILMVSLMREMRGDLKDIGKELEEIDKRLVRVEASDASMQFQQLRDEIRDSLRKMDSQSKEHAALKNDVVELRERVSGFQRLVNWVAGIAAGVIITVAGAGMIMMLLN